MYRMRNLLYLRFQMIKIAVKLDVTGNENCRSLTIENLNAKRFYILIVSIESEPIEHFCTALELLEPLQKIAFKRIISDVTRIHRKFF